MFGSEMIEVAVGTIFVFLLLSLICSASHEMIESWLKMRAVDLERGIRELLHDPTGTNLTQKLYDHPLVYGLFKGDYNPGLIKGKKNCYPSRSTLPSYIPAQNFALALMDIILPATSATPDAAASPSGAAGASAPTPPAVPTSPPSPAPDATPIPGSLKPLRDAIGAIANPNVERALMTLVDAAGDDVSKARKNIEMWYDSTMDRVSSWYKQRSQKIVLLLGLFAAIAVNVDIITIIRSVPQNQAMRSTLVAAAQEYAKIQPGDADGMAEQRIYNLLKEIERLGFPLGWNRDDPRLVPFGFWEWVSKVLGWLLTAVAVSLGASFWLDLLNKFMGARSGIKPRQRDPGQ